MSLDIIKESVNSMTALAGAACDLLGTLGALLGGIILAAAKIAEAAINALLKIIGSIAKFFGALAGIIDSIIGLVLEAVGLVTGFIDGLKLFLGKLVILISAGGCKGVVAAAGALGAGISSAIDSVNSFSLTGAIDTLTAGVENLASEGFALVNDVGSAVTSVSDAIKFEIFKAGVTIE